MDVAHGSVVSGFQPDEYYHTHQVESLQHHFQPDEYDHTHQAERLCCVRISA